MGKGEGVCNVWNLAESNTLAPWKSWGIAKKQKTHRCVDVYTGLNQLQRDGLLVVIRHAGVRKEVQEGRPLVVCPPYVSPLL